MTTYKMNKLAASIIVTACSLAGCAIDDGYGYSNQGGYSVEERSYGTSYGGTTWYREEVPYYRNDYDHNRNGIPDNREIDRNRNGIPDNREVDRNRNGIPDNREIDRNRNGIPDNREVDRNHNGIPDNKEVDRNKDGKPDRPNSNHTWNSGSNHDGYKTPDNKPNNNYGDRNGNVYGR